MLESKAGMIPAQEMGEIQAEIEHLQKSKVELGEEIVLLRGKLGPILNRSPKTEAKEESKKACVTSLGEVIWATAVGLHELRQIVTDIIGDLEL